MTFDEVADLSAEVCWNVLAAKCQSVVGSSISVSRLCGRVSSLI